MASKLEKYIWLADQLRRPGGATLEELGRWWERSSLYDGVPLSERTFHRYRRALEERFGLRIRCDRHDFTYHIVEEDAAGDGMQSWLLDTISVDNLLRESRDLQERILFENIPSGQQHLARILTAMRDGAVLEMTYRRFSDEAPYTTWLHPYFVKVFNQRWYVVGPTGRHPEEPHVYALDRVLSLTLTPERFDYPSDFRPAAFFADSYGIFRADAPPQRILLRAGEREAKFLRSLPLHPSQYELSAGEISRLDLGTPLREGDALFALRLCPTLDFVQYLLSQGDELEVLEPASLREELGRRAGAIAVLYC